MKAFAYYYFGCLSILQPIIVTYSFKHWWYLNNLMGQR